MWRACFTVWGYTGDARRPLHRGYASGMCSRRTRLTSRGARGRAAVLAVNCAWQPSIRADGEMSERATGIYAATGDGNMQRRAAATSGGRTCGHGHLRGSRGACRGRRWGWIGATQRGRARPGRLGAAGRGGALSIGGPGGPQRRPRRGAHSRAGAGQRCGT